MISAPFTIGIALAAVIIDHSIVRKVSDSAYSIERSRRFGLTVMGAAAVPVLLVISAMVTAFVSRFVLKRFQLEYLDAPTFIMVILGITLVAEALLGAKGNPGSLNRMVSGAAAGAVILGLASSLSSKPALVTTGATLRVGVAYFVLFLAYHGVREKITAGLRVKGVPRFSRELVIAGLLALVAIGSIASLHH